jgi:hypothetical protein
LTWVIQSSLQSLQGKLSHNGIVGFK